MSPKYHVHLEQFRQGKEIIVRLNTVNSLRRGTGVFKSSRRGNFTANLILASEHSGKRNRLRCKRFYERVMRDMEIWFVTAEELVKGHEDEDRLTRLIEKRRLNDRWVLRNAICDLDDFQEISTQKAILAQEASNHTEGGLHLQNFYIAEARVARTLGTKAHIRTCESSGVISLNPKRHLVVAQYPARGLGPSLGTDELQEENDPLPFDSSTFPGSCTLGSGGTLVVGTGWPFVPLTTRIPTPHTPDDLKAQMDELQQRLTEIATANPQARNSALARALQGIPRDPDVPLDATHHAEASPSEDPRTTSFNRPGNDSTIGIILNSNNKRPASHAIRTPRPTDSLPSEQMRQNMECSICYEQKSTIVLVPCGHLSMCEWCADEAVPTDPKTGRIARARDAEGEVKEGRCPMCRAVVRKKLRVHMP